MKRAFTLIELLIAILIIGILTTLSYPTFQRVIYKAHGAGALGVISAIREGEEVYYIEHGGYFNLNISSGETEWAKLGLEDYNHDPGHKFEYDVVVGRHWDRPRPDYPTFEAIIAYSKNRNWPLRKIIYWNNPIEETLPDGTPSGDRPYPGGTITWDFEGQIYDWE